MMRFTTLFTKQSEEEKDIAFRHPLIGKMRLRRPALAEQANAIAGEHRIMMAQVLRAELTAAGMRGVIAQPEIAIDGVRGLPRGDRQADGSSRDDRRGSATRGAVEALAGEDNSHVILVP